MTFSNMINKRFKTLLYLVFAVVFFLVMRQEVVLFSDSGGYIDGDIIRSPTYPLFLDILQGVFGSYFNTATAFFQVIFGFIAVYYFITSLKKALKLHPLWLLLMALLVLSPYVYNHHVANRFLSEALSYPLYLLVVSRFFLLLAKGEKRYVWQAIPLLFLLVLTRNQFLYIVPIALLSIGWLAYSAKAYKRWLFPALALIVLPFVSSLADKTYHSIRHDAFVSTPWTGLHLLTPAMFVADKEDGTIFTSEKEKRLFDSLYSSLAKKQLNIHHLPPEDASQATAVYRENFSDIANHTIYDEGKEIVAPNETVNNKYIFLDAVTKSMAMPLIMDNFGPWLKVYLQNFVFAFGTARDVLLILILLGFGIFILLKNKSIDAKIIMLACSLLLANAAIVSIGMHTIKRFTFYNDWVVFLIIFILINSYSNRTKNI